MLFSSNNLILCIEWGKKPQNTLVHLKRKLDCSNKNESELSAIFAYKGRTIWLVSFPS